jgi:hypothetical protein
MLPAIIALQTGGGPLVEHGKWNHKRGGGARRRRFRRRVPEQWRAA